MAITEESRHHLFTRLEQVLGHEEAVTMMEHLPPVGWADVATKRDLDHLGEHLGQRLTAEISGLEVRMVTAFGDFREQVHRDQQAKDRQLMVALLVALLSAVAAVAGLR